MSFERTTCRAGTNVPMLERHYRELASMTVRSLSSGATHQATSNASVWDVLSKDNATSRRGPHTPLLPALTNSQDDLNMQNVRTNM